MSSNQKPSQHFGVSFFIRAGAIAAATVVCALTSLAAWQLSMPMTAPTLFPFSETFYEKARAANSPRSAISWAEQAVRAGPHRAENWVLLGYSYQKADKYVSPRVVGAIRRSYDVAALSPAATPARLPLIFNDWKFLPVDIQRLSIQEAKNYAAGDAGRAFLQNEVPQIRDDRARFQFALIVVMGEQAQAQMMSDYIQTHHNPRF